MDLRPGLAGGRFDGKSKKIVRQIGRAARMNYIAPIESFPWLCHADP
jgi:hypothetical protein